MIFLLTAVQIFDLKKLLNRFVYPENIWDNLPKSFKFDIETVVCQFDDGSFYLMFKENDSLKEISSPSNSLAPTLEFQKSKLIKFQNELDSNFPDLQIYQSENCSELENQYYDQNETEGNIF